MEKRVVVKMIEVSKNNRGLNCDLDVESMQWNSWGEK